MLTNDEIDFICGLIQNSYENAKIIAVHRDNKRQTQKGLKYCKELKLLSKKLMKMKVNE